MTHRVLAAAENPQPLLVSYGGGHAQIMLAVAAELERRGQPYHLLGLTTAEMTFRRAGLAPMSVSELIDPNISARVRARAAELAQPADHPDISDEQTIAYFTVGYADLVARFGTKEAEERVTLQGRKAFEPLTAFASLLERLRPSIVVSTTSPRFELAALRAARQAGIPSLAVGDMYLVAEQEWILTEPYAKDLVVISEGVAAMLADSGRLSSRLHVLGNPAFDALAPAPSDAAVRALERERLGIGERTCLFWPLGGAADKVFGRNLLQPAAVAAFLDQVCERDRSLTYVLRPHPNWPVGELHMRHGQVDDSVELERALLASDLVCVEASTVGLQAVLMGIPTICYNFSDYVLYPKFGWAAHADTLSELEALIVDRTYTPPPASLRAHVGNASARVCDLIGRLVADGNGAAG